MRLDPAELRELAGFFAKRFPAAADRLRFARASGMTVESTDHGDAVDAWVRVLEVAQRRGTLAALARSVAAAAPGDENLQAACRELSPSAPKKTGLIAMAAVGAVLLAIAVVVGMRDEAPAPVAGTHAVDLPPEPPSPKPPDPAEAEAPPPPAPPPVVPAAVEKPAAEPSVAPAAPVARDTARCPGSPGDVVGYWYAGEASPGEAGATITLTRDARVRAEYPQASNRHNARTPERCVLRAGMKVRLSQAPIDASNGHWWVPYAVGDAAG